MFISTKTKIRVTLISNKTWYSSTTKDFYCEEHTNNTNDCDKFVSTLSTLRYPKLNFI